MIPLKGSDPFKKHRGFILSHWQQNKNSEDGYSRCFFSKPPQINPPLCNKGHPCTPEQDPKLTELSFS